MGLILYGGSVIGSVMLADGVLTTSTYGISFTLLKLFLGGLSALVAMYVGKFGIKSSFVFGAVVIIAAALFLAFFASTPWHFPIAMGAVLGTGVAFSTIVPLSTGVSRWFTRMRGQAMAAALTASSVAGLVFAPLISAFIQYLGFGWRQMWFMVAGLMIIPIIVALIFIKEYPAEIGQEPDGGPIVDNADDAKSKPGTDHLRTNYDWTPKQALRTPSFWFIAVLACITQYAWFFFTSQWLPIMRSFKFSSTLAAFTISTFTISSMPARIISGFLIDRIKPKFVFILGFSFTAIAYVFALTINGTTMVPAFVSAVCAALGFGLCYIAFATTPAQYFGVKAYSQLNGSIFMMESVVSCLAPSVTSLLFAMFGTYSVSFVLVFAVSVFGVVLSFFLKMPKPPRVTLKSQEDI
jgi:MFS family permease